VVRTGERELENRIRWKKTKGERGMEGEKRKEAGSACLFEKFLQYNPDSKQTNKQTQLKAISHMQAIARGNVRGSFHK